MSIIFLSNDKRQRISYDAEYLVIEEISPTEAAKRLTWPMGRWRLVWFGARCIWAGIKDMFTGGLHRDNV